MLKKSSDKSSIINVKHHHYTNSHRHAKSPPRPTPRKPGELWPECCWERLRSKHRPGSRAVAGGRRGSGAGQCSKGTLCPRFRSARARSPRRLLSVSRMPWRLGLWFGQPFQDAPKRHSSPLSPARMLPAFTAGQSRASGRASAVYKPSAHTFPTAVLNFEIMLGLFFFRFRQDAWSGSESRPTRRDTESMWGVGVVVGLSSTWETLYVDLKGLTGWLPGTSSLSDPPLPQLSMNFAGAKNSASGDMRQELETE